MKTATVDKYRIQNGEVKYRILDGALSSPKSCRGADVALIIDNNGLWQSRNLIKFCVNLYGKGREKSGV